MNPEDKQYVLDMIDDLFDAKDRENFNKGMSMLLLHVVRVADDEGYQRALKEQSQ